MMPRRKHTKTQAVVACTDANQRVRESLLERARIAEAKQKKFEMLREQYMEEMKRREEAAKKPMIISPTISPATDRDIANE